MRDDVHPLQSPGRVRRAIQAVIHTFAAIPWRNALSLRWWWQWFRRSQIQTGRLTTLLALLAVLVIRLDDPGIVQLLRARVFDFYQQVRPRALEGESPVVIVDIDEKSLNELGQFPWPRSVVARLISQLTAADAAVIGFDIAFPEADQTSVSKVIQSLPATTLDDATRDRLMQVPTNDMVLANAIEASGRVVLGQAVTPDPITYAGDPPLTSFATVGDDPKNFLERNSGVLRPLAVLNTPAAGRGIISFSGKFFDGIVRQVPMVVSAGDDLYPALSLEMLRVKLGARTIGIATDHVSGGVTQIFVRPARSRERYAIKTDANGEIWAYFRPHESFASSYLSAADVVAGRVPKERIAGKFVLVGTSAIGLFDLRSTPLDHVLPGVEVHGDILENIIFQKQLNRPPQATLVEWAATAVIGLVMIILTPMVSARIGALSFLTIAASIVWYSWNAFTTRLELYDAVFPVAVALLFYIFLTYSGYTRTEASRAQVRSAFGQYLSPALVERLAEDPSKLTLGGENRDMSFMFSDVRGFTTISELFDAQGLTRLINRLLTPLTDVILKTQGTIDKYMGDCVMAFWNAPLDVPDHPAQSCRAALAMIDAVAKVNADLEAEAKAEGREHRKLAVGIGINTGIACVGNMGSEQRFGYSVLGDNVNLASRLEGQSKTYHLTIVIGDNTAARVPEFAVLELDLIKVKGKHQAVRIHTLLGDERTAAEPWFKELKPLHVKLLADYRAQQWDAAESDIAACRRLLEGRSGLPGEMLGYYDVTAERIADFRADPPPTDWDGVYVAESK